MSTRDEVVQLLNQCTDETLLNSVKRLLDKTTDGDNMVNEPQTLLNTGEPILLFKNEKNAHRMLQIDLDAISDEDLWEDIYDLLEVERRKDEETVPWEVVKRNLGLDHV